jgi:hypothetical protein
MARRKMGGQANSRVVGNGAKLGLEEKLWAAADELSEPQRSCRESHVFFFSNKSVMDCRGRELNHSE